MFNVVNKQAVSALPLPWLVSWLQLLAGVCVIVPAWVVGLRSAPLVDGRFVVGKFGPMAALHATGHSAQVAAMGSGTVFMVAVVKASEPIVGTAVSILATGALPSKLSTLSLAPIVAGVAIAASKPGARLSPADLLTASSGAALLSTVVFAVAKVLAKRLMTPTVKRERRIDAANNYALLTCVSCAILAVPACVIDVPKADAAWAALDSQARGDVLKNVAVSGLAYYASNECSFQILDLLGPVPQAVCNSLKRVFVFLAAVLFLGEQVTPTKAAGSALAVFGVLCYSLAKTAKPKAASK